MRIPTPLIQSWIAHEQIKPPPTPEEMRSVILNNRLRVLAGWLFIASSLAMVCSLCIIFARHVTTRNPEQMVSAAFVIRLTTVSVIFLALSVWLMFFLKGRKDAVISMKAEKLVQDFKALRAATLKPFDMIRDPRAFEPSQVIAKDKEWVAEQTHRYEKMAAMMTSHLALWVILELRSMAVEMGKQARARMLTRSPISPYDKDPLADQFRASIDAMKPFAILNEETDGGTFIAPIGPAKIWDDTAEKD